ncbi:MAG: DUF5698 domain-containing protein [Anaerolineae bacterium]
MEAIGAALLIFALRVTDMSLDTIRLLMVMRGRKWVAGVIGATQAAVFIVAVSKVLTGPLNAWTVLGYAAGFGTGVVLGIIAEERLAIGYIMVRVYSPEFGSQIAEALRGSGHAATEIVARGRTGMITVVNCVVARRDLGTVRGLIDTVDANAFVTVDQVSKLERGYFRG